MHSKYKTQRGEAHRQSVMQEGTDPSYRVLSLENTHFMRKKYGQEWLVNEAYKSSTRDSEEGGLYKLEASLGFTVSQARAGEERRGNKRKGRGEDR
jgi:hypothetical protein